MTSVFLFVAFFAGAQEADSVNSNNAENIRPAETELFFDESPAPASETDIPLGEELPGIGFGDILRMVLVLGFVIALIYGFVWLLKRFSSQKAESEDVINLLSTRPLKGDSALHLVEVGQRMFLVGSNSNSVNLISEIDDADSINEVRLSASQTPVTVRSGFSKLFKEKFGAGLPNTVLSGPDKESVQVTEDPGGFMRSQRERLKDL